MGMQPTAANLGDVRLPLTFILSGLTLFVFAQGLLLGGVDSLMHGTVQAPYLLSVAHLLVLGFGTMVAMGVMYQLVPVAMQTKIYHPGLTGVQYGIYLLGVLGIWWSFYHFSAFSLLIFASIAILGILLFEYNLWISIRKADHSEIRTAVGSALANLLITIGLGLWLAIQLYRSGSGDLLDRLLAVHILFGTVGWFTLLIIGFSFKLIPMFTLSHGYDTRFGKAAIYAIDCGLIVAAIGIFGKLAVLDYCGGVLIVAGFVCYGMQLKLILERRMRKRFDPGVAAALCAMPLTLLFMV
ncbi:MAG TPA: hypothetical protein VFK37_10025, partial [Bacillales bacterium]|nr:hypothetical protein [Bacillales bacterium]